MPYLTRPITVNSTRQLANVQSDLTQPVYLTRPIATDTQASVQPGVAKPEIEDSNLLENLFFARRHGGLTPCSGSRGYDETTKNI